MLSIHGDPFSDPRAKHLSVKKNVLIKKNASSYAKTSELSSHKLGWKVNNVQRTNVSALNYPQNRQR